MKRLEWPLSTQFIANVTGLIARISTNLSLVATTRAEESPLEWLLHEEVCLFGTITIRRKRAGQVFEVVHEIGGRGRTTCVDFYYLF